MMAIHPATGDPGPPPLQSGLHKNCLQETLFRSELGAQESGGLTNKVDRTPQVAQRTTVSPPRWTSTRTTAR